MTPQQGLPQSVDRPLEGLRILDMVDGPLSAITRYLADLGARVDRLDEGVAPDAFRDLAENSGKVRHRLADDSEAVHLIAKADAIVASSERWPDLERFRRNGSRVVTMTVSPFGADTPLRDWVATDAVLHALSGGLSRSGIRGRPPLLPPGQLALECAAAQGAYALTTALYRALRTGDGDHLDFAALDGAVQALDPGYGVSGSATMGKPVNLLSRDRPPEGFQYPILPCADGYVRLCLLAKRQWRGMFRWMGEPEAFAAPEFDNLMVRYKSPNLIPHIQNFLAGLTRAEIEAEGQRFGVPVASVLTLGEFMNSDHVRTRGAIRPVTEDAAAPQLPNGVITIDGERMGPGEPSPGAGWTTPPVAGATAMAFEGLKVLDLGVIVVGAEQGRLLGDQGADVIKIESRAYPDGNRQSYLSYGLSVSFAAGNRNKRSLGLNLREPEGRALFLEMAAKADVMLSNFKPGTLASLGLAYEDIAAVNPAIVMVDSSAFGATGPWSGRMGYGPLVRAATGLTLAWRYPGDPTSFSDSVTIYPDHVAARIGAMAAVALLIRRLRTQRGGTASIAQSEVMLSQFAVDVARVSLGENSNGPRDWPAGVYPARGDDEWCVIDIRGQEDWDRLASVIGLAGEAFSSPAQRLAARDRIDATITHWLASRSPMEAAEILQAVGVPAAPMLRVVDLPKFSYFKARRFYRVEAHPYLREPVVAERRHVTAASMGDALARPAPLAGEQAEDVLATWLGFDPRRTAELVKAQVVEPVDPQILSEAQSAVHKPRGHTDPVDVI